MGQQGNSFWGLVGAFAAGAAAGAVAGLLLAPRAGADTRRRLAGIPRAVGEAYAQAKEAGAEAFTHSLEAQEGGKPASHRP